MKDYCTQNEGQCETCSLVNYQKDCYNQPISKGYYKTAMGECCRKCDTQLTKAGNQEKEIGVCPVCHEEFILWRDGE